MKIVRASFEILSLASDPLRLIELAGRTCYKSEDSITDESAPRFVRNVLDRHHESVIEHSTMTVKFIVDRGVSHELVRHRLAAYSQESTRYVRYDGAKEGRELTFVLPCFWADEANLTPSRRVAFYCWEGAMQDAETHYLHMVNDLHAKPEEARSVLPNSLKTEVVMTANFREWRHVFKMRTASDAHPQMREVMRPLLSEVRQRVPVVFDDVGVVS